MRVLLLISDSRPSGKSGGRVHYSPGPTDVDEELGQAWANAGVALILHGKDAVHAPGGKTLCTARHADGFSCVLPEGHKGGRHYDFSKRARKGEDVGAGWWSGELVVEAPAEPKPRPCPTRGCDAGPFAHGGECKVPAAPAPSSPSSSEVASPTTSPDAASDAPDEPKPRKQGRK